MIKGWPKLILALVCSLIVSAAYGFAFSGPNPQPGQLTFSGFSNGAVGATISGPIANVQAGQFQGFFDPTSEADGPGAEPDDFLRFFCIDIYHYANGGPNPYTRDLLTSLSPAKLTLLTRLFDDDYPNKTQGTYYNGAVTTFGDFVDADHSAAFQLVVWEIFFGDGTSLGSAPFIASSTPAVMTIANGWLNTINNIDTGTPVGWTFFTFTSTCQSDHCYQTYLSAEFTQPLRFTPEPGSLVLLCVAVLAAWAAAMRRRQTA